jgi:hypothetical protein
MTPTLYLLCGCWTTFLIWLLCTLVAQRRRNEAKLERHKKMMAEIEQIFVQGDADFKKACDEVIRRHVSQYNADELV